MSSGVNKCILVGNACKDPELRYTQAGKAVCTMRLAMSERRKVGEEWRDHAEFMDVVVWEKTAENVSQYVKKGKQVYVEGRFQTREYDDKDGNKRKAVEVVAHTVIFLGGGERTESVTQSNNSKASAPIKPIHDGFDDDQLPF